MPALWYKFKSQKKCHDTNLSMFCPYLQCSLRWIIAPFITKQELLCSYNLTLPGMRCFGQMSEFLLYVSEEGAQTCFLLGRNDRTVNAKYRNVTCQSFPLCHLSPSWPNRYRLWLHLLVGYWCALPWKNFLLAPHGTLSCYEGKVQHSWHQKGLRLT